MRLPFIIALIVVITLPKDVNGLVEDVSTQVRVASAAIGKMLGRDDSLQVAEAKVDDLAKSGTDTAKVVPASLR